MTTEPAQPPLAFNPFDPAFRIDPYPTYRRLHEDPPAEAGPFGLKMLVRYADCSSMLRHPLAGNDQRKTPNFAEQVRQSGFDPDEEMTRTRPFLSLDPPDHTRLRGIVNKAFTPRVVEDLRPRIKQIVDDLLDAAQQKGSMDIIEDVAYPLPVQRHLRDDGRAAGGQRHLPRLVGRGRPLASTPKTSSRRTYARSASRSSSSSATTSRNSSSRSAPSRATTCSPRLSRRRSPATA